MRPLRLALVACSATQPVHDSQPDMGDGGTRDGEIGADGSVPDSLSPRDDVSREDCRPGLDIEHFWPTVPPAEFPDRLFVSSTPLWVDLDKDGVNELAFVSSQHDGRRGALRILYRDGRIHTSPTAELSPHDHISAGDLDDDGDLEIVAVRERWGLLAYDHHAAEVWFSPYPTLPRTYADEPADSRGEPPHHPVESTFELPGERHPGDVLGATYVHRRGGAVHVQDLDHDGLAEVLFGGIVLNGDGALRWHAGRVDGWLGTNDVYGPFMCVADLLGGGDLEVVVGAQLFTSSGERLWGESPAGVCALADINGDETLEVVVVHQNRAVVRNAAGGIVAEQQIDGRDGWLGGAVGAGPGGPPTVGNYVGGHEPDLVVSTAKKLMVFDPTCDRCDPLAQFRYPTPRHLRSNVSPMTSAMLFDFDRDGRNEAIVRTPEWLLILSETWPWRAVPVQTPSISGLAIPIDWEGDNELEIVVGLSAFVRGSRRTETGLGLARGRCSPLRGRPAPILSHASRSPQGTPPR